MGSSSLVMVQVCSVHLDVDVAPGVTVATQSPASSRRRSDLGSAVIADRKFDGRLPVHVVTVDAGLEVGRGGGAAIVVDDGLDERQGARLGLVLEGTGDRRCGRVGRIGNVG